MAVDPNGHGVSWVGLVHASLLRMLFIVVEGVVRRDFF